MLIDKFELEIARKKNHFSNPMLHKPWHKAISAPEHILMLSAISVEINTLVETCFVSQFNFSHAFSAVLVLHVQA